MRMGNGESTIQIDIHRGGTVDDNLLAYGMICHEVIDRLGEDFVFGIGADAHLAGNSPGGGGSTEGKCLGTVVHDFYRHCTVHIDTEILLVDSGGCAGLYDIAFIEGDMQLLQQGAHGGFAAGHSLDMMVVRYDYHVGIRHRLAFAAEEQKEQAG